MGILGKDGNIVSVDHDPEVVATDVPEGTIIIWGHVLYCKEDNGSTTNVALQGHVDLRDDEAGGSKVNLVPFTSDPAVVDNDVFLREADSEVNVVFYDGTTKRVLASEQSASILHVYASSLGAADEITPSTPENLVKGCTLADAGELGSHWTIANAGTDTMELKYAGKRTKKFRVTLVVNFTSDENGNVYSLWLYKVAAQQAASLQKAEIVTGADGVTMAVHHIIELAENDTLRLMIDAAATTPVVTPRSLMLTATPL